MNNDTSELTIKGKYPYCCNIVMKKQRVYLGPNKGGSPSFICLNCGKLVLDQLEFDRIKIKEA